MFERPTTGERAIVVHPELPAVHDPEGLDEVLELARSASVEPLEVVTARLSRPHPKYFVGTGKAQEIAERVQAHGAELVLVNHELSPIQERNLEALARCRVLDRTTLILDIFAQRARSHEGKLQVELAQLKHLATRLVRGWTHLERQKGGIGLRGPGETQLETDRRLIAERIRRLTRRLDKVQRQREQSRRARRRSETPVVSLVGYTNAGKSTLFNAVTGADVLQAGHLFATLDPTLRRIEGLAGQPVLLADTVGFIRHLPHDLIAAFRATLQETREAHLLLHVVDASDPSRDERIEQVQRVLAQVGAEEVPQLLVYNKVDRCDSQPRLDRDHNGEPWRVWTSARRGDGLDLLLEALHERFGAHSVHRWIELPPEAGKLRAKLFELGAVLDERMSDSGSFELEIELTRARAEQLTRLHGIDAQLVRRELLAEAV